MSGAIKGIRKMEKSKLALVSKDAKVNVIELNDELLECVAGGNGSTSIPVFIG
jgi:hypothetical protein